MDSQTPIRHGWDFLWEQGLLNDARHAQLLLEALSLTGFYLLALGKLGARELNLSSDIDLVFAYPEPGVTTTGTTNQQFFVRLGQQLIQALDALTADGFAFRVDMRLRPWGDAGPLASSFDALENYLVLQGREWERYAWIKARALTGDRGPELMERVLPFVYRRHMDYNAIAA